MIEHGKKCEAILKKHKFLRLPHDEDGRPLGRGGHSRWAKRIKDFLFQIDIYPQSRFITWQARWTLIESEGVQGFWGAAKADEELSELENEGSAAEELDALISSAKRILRNSPRFKKCGKLQLPSTRKLLGIEIE
jgi:hypothetical protein